MEWNFIYCRKLNIPPRAVRKKVDKHNGLIERTYKLEERVALNERDMKVANHRIDDLEREVG